MSEPLPSRRAYDKPDILTLVLFVIALVVGYKAFKANPEMKAAWSSTPFAVVHSKTARLNLCLNMGLHFAKLDFL
jgi:hypothetical protein